MVRLKVSDEAYSEKITGISIPYGAIKSKAIATKMDAKKDFNSLWCD